MTLPNLITIFRLLLVPTIVYLLVAEALLLAFLAFVIAGVSDGIDGLIAKHFGQATRIGAYLDPLADKALLVSIFVTLGYLHELPLWFVVLVVSRDIFIVAAVVLSWMVTHPVTMAPVTISKINTGAQITLAAIVLADLAFGLQWLELREVGVFLVAALTLISAATYLVHWVRHMNMGNEGQGF